MTTKNSNDELNNGTDITDEPLVELIQDLENIEVDSKKIKANKSQITDAQGRDIDLEDKNKGPRVFAISPNLTKPTPFIPIDLSEK